MRKGLDRQIDETARARIGDFDLALERVGFEAEWRHDGELELPNRQTGNLEAPILVRRHVATKRPTADANRHSLDRPIVDAPFLGRIAPPLVDATVHTTARSRRADRGQI